MAEAWAGAVATWHETQGDLPQVYRVLVTHPALASTLRQKVRQL